MSTSQESQKIKAEAEKLGLVETPCAYCNYKHYNGFDLVNHLLEKHKDELVKLPIGKGSMEKRVECVIEQTRRHLNLLYLRRVELIADQ
jgi:hypothetical protein